MFIPFFLKPKAEIAVQSQVPTFEIGQFACFRWQDFRLVFDMKEATRKFRLNDLNLARSKHWQNLWSFQSRSTHEKGFVLNLNYFFNSAFDFHHQACLYQFPMNRLENKVQVYYALPPNSKLLELKATPILPEQVEKLRHFPPFYDQGLYQSVLTTGRHKYFLLSPEKLLAFCLGAQTYAQQ